MTPVGRDDNQTVDDPRDARTPGRSRRRTRQALALIGCADRAHEDCARLFWLDDLERVHIGRGAFAAEVDGAVLHVCHPDDRISRRHAVLTRSRAAWKISDDGSRNGLWIRGERVQERTLCHGDIIETGRCFWRYIEYRPLLDRRDEANMRVAANDFPPTRTISPELIDQLAMAEMSAAGDKPLLIQGETGTGKEHLARQVHAWSRRPGGFHAVNIPAAAHLIESELFGHVKGAFTGAVQDRVGHIEAAADGTLLMDEIGDLDEKHQPKLLRFLQDGEFNRVGECKSRGVNVRVVGATNRDIPAMVAAGKFREDLYARFGHTVLLPSLRNRIEDLGILLAHFLAGAGEVLVDADLYRRLLAYAWPRNLRQLGDVSARALLVSRGSGRIRAEDVPPLPGEPSLPDATPLLDSDRERLADVLKRHRGNLVAVAKELEHSRPYVYRQLKKYGFDAKQFRSEI